MRWSVYAALSNVGAMVAYGLALTVVFVAGGDLPWGLGLLVVIPVMVASTYVGYRGRLRGSRRTQRRGTLTPA